MTKPKLPHSIQAEEGVILAVLADPDCLGQTATLDEEDFYDPHNGVILTAMRKLDAAGEPIDMRTVTDAIDQQPTRLQFLAFADRDVTSVNVGSYVEKVKAFGVRRKAHAAMVAASQEVLLQRSSPAEVMSELDREATRLLGGRNQEACSLASLIPDAVDLIGQGKRNGVKVGFDKLDELTGGFLPGQMIILGARPSIGKTALAVQWAKNAASGVNGESGVPTGIISVEMPKEDLTLRMISDEASIPSSAFRGELDGGQAKRLGLAAGVLSELPLYIVDTNVHTIGGIRVAARRLVREQGVKLLVVDYLQLIQGAGKSRVEDVTHQSQGLKLLARELNVPIVVLSQLNRGVEMREDKHPKMADLRDSGSIEQDADIIAFLYRDNYYSDFDKDKPGTADLDIAKHRNGACGRLSLHFEPQFTRFSDSPAMYEVTRGGGFGGDTDNISTF